MKQYFSNQVVKEGREVKIYDCLEVWIEIDWIHR